MCDLFLLTPWMKGLTRLSPPILTPCLDKVFEFFGDVNSLHG